MPRCARSRRRAGWTLCPKKLLQTALLRREHPEATLSELAELHEPPTSKSTVNHRMRKLLALAAEGTETTEEGPA